MKDLYDVIIGITGELSSGKDTVSAFLVEEHGFVHVATGDLLRFYIMEHQLGTIDRDLERSTANFLRAEHGADYLARLALEEEANKLVVSGLRNPHEVDAVKKKGGFIIAVLAPIEIRYKRLKARGRLGDDVTFEKFKAQEEVEMVNLNPNAQIISESIAMADYEIVNDGTLADLHQKIEKVLSEIAKKKDC
ncbi:TPA: hypothetical protein DDW69_02415 [candidate division CPR2 bacterium]|uniref:Dephospho-CoA kinase n=1 Tax=candidate division CPR2 bacterium GW2011_GWC1_41_48 TaxID=1618344 RepID=A0A0G0WA70_UNCC2|nr:MAG: hypothetical protein UT47_C0001G0285 [candidate division CPR2 bacterium GW2011_GWC2_39_35]KKR27632.1 MAG: hypothetical protein UT59_C0051G0013 [candidate division CPR2 bacterium GW2011_GWD1_39_7]KKR28837.1 MAG: hypothetical protein UT60_C0011G0003 [candidate division CPR2 bacterium GW2011_GWD2_39_7]KKS09880.1 MAG: hypothetical protein UU65_C0001G0285 [candidate division CPR2 bacterium GW2011_GWC1_41_48]OGB59454.1 MAG: hypothetical protein A2Y27_03885 [candidate division CPR2 bacterium G